MAKLALRCHTVLEALGESFEFLILSNKFIILNLLFSYGLTEHSIGLPDLLHALSLSYGIGLIAPLLINCRHQLLMHLSVFFKLLLSELKLLLKMLLLLFPNLLLLMGAGLVEMDDFFQLLLVLKLHFIIVFLAKFIIVLVF